MAEKNSDAGRGEYDVEYRAWRETQLRQCDADYAEFCRELATTKAARAGGAGGETLKDQAAAGHGERAVEEFQAETRGERFQRLFNDWRRERYVGVNKIGAAPLLFGGQNTQNTIYAND